jgi:hypothetical protein
MFLNQGRGSKALLFDKDMIAQMKALPEQKPVKCSSSCTSVPLNLSPSLNQCFSFGKNK